MTNHIKEVYKMRNLIKELDKLPISIDNNKEYDNKVILISYHNKLSDRFGYNPGGWGYVVLDDSIQSDYGVVGSYDSLYCKLLGLYKALITINSKRTIAIETDDLALTNLLTGNLTNIPTRYKSILNKCLFYLSNYSEILIQDLDNKFTYYQQVLNKLKNRNLYLSYTSRQKRNKNNTKKKLNKVIKDNHHFKPLFFIPLTPLNFTTNKAVQFTISSKRNAKGLREGSYLIKNKGKQVRQKKISYLKGTSHYVLMRSLIQCLNAGKAYRNNKIIINTDCKWLFELLTNEDKLSYYAKNRGRYTSGQPVANYALMRKIIFSLKNYHNVFVYLNQKGTK